ncbi:hypothetical protein PENFLA_c010G07823 [Penicillium flavigenum]|uniref:Uncharacterized protein n=1 Tax=Penicillium flavigenum TaxID=254877 RepID=A0A1V6TEU3_9EURO|nr:hypothetical protein PENFLA_c010G07823 [Penicillium flavigenum]
MAASSFSERLNPDQFGRHWRNKGSGSAEVHANADGAAPVELWCRNRMPLLGKWPPPATAGTQLARLRQWILTFLGKVALGCELNTLGEVTKPLISTSKKIYKAL